MENKLYILTGHEIAKLRGIEERLRLSHYAFKVLGHKRMQLADDLDHVLACAEVNAVDEDDVVGWGEERAA
jgi:hypothetical protein